jgi:hypothetical protein
MEKVETVAGWKRSAADAEEAARRRRQSAIRCLRTDEHDRFMGHFLKEEWI